MLLEVLKLVEFSGFESSCIVADGADVPWSSGLDGVYCNGSISSVSKASIRSIVCRSMATIVIVLL